MSFAASLTLAPNWVEWVSAVGWTLLHFCWQGALVGAGYAFLRWAFAKSRPQTRYALGLAALALLATLPAITLWRLAPTTESFAFADGVIAASDVIGATMLPAQSANAAIEPWLPWLVGAWLVGVAFASLRTLWQYLRMRKLCKQGAEPLPEWDVRLAQLVRRFGVTRPVRLVKSTIVQTPSLIGWIKPVIVLPTSVLLGLSPHQIELVIAHELGHIRRWDYAVNLLQIAVETVLFYHPVVHWISRDVREEREACCDDLVLHRGADPVDYAATLASLEELRGFTHAPALAASGGFLLGRIRRIVGAEQAMFTAPLSGGQGLLVALLAFLAVLSVRPVTREALLTVDRMLPETPAVTVARAAAMTIENLVQPTPIKPRIMATMAPAGDIEAAESDAADVVTLGSVTPSRPALELALPARTSPATKADAGVGDLRFDLARVATAVSTRAPAVTAPNDDAIATETYPPVYPRRAAVAGIEGQVTLSFRVDATGRARDIRVASRSGDQEFEREAMAALRRWRFAADSTESSLRFVQTFDFALGGVTASASAAAAGEDCRRALGTRICKRDE